MNAIEFDCRNCDESHEVLNVRALSLTGCDGCPSGLHDWTALSEEVAA